MVNQARDSAFSFPNLLICSEIHKEGTEKNLELSDRREERCFKMIREHLEQKGLPVIVKRRT